MAESEGKGFMYVILACVGGKPRRWLCAASLCLACLTWGSGLALARAVFLHGAGNIDWCALLDYNVASDIRLMLGNKRHSTIESSW